MNGQSQAGADASELLTRVRAFVGGVDLDSADDEAFNRLALEVFAFQFHNVPIYRQLCEGRGAIPSAVVHWAGIPALPTAAFKEYDVSNIAESDRSCVFHSSGTTGRASSRHFHNAASLALYEASLLRWFEPHFGLRGGRLVFLTPEPAAAPHSSLIHMFGAVRNQLGGAGSVFAGKAGADGAWTLDFDVIDKVVAEEQPLGILGTAFSFVHWLDHLAAGKRRLRLPNGSRIMETGGYKGRSRTVAKAELRRLLTRYLGVPESHILTEYGMSELSSQAYDGVAGSIGARSFQFPPWVRTQVISPESGGIAAEGEIGLLRVFDLANLFSVMAVQTEDLAVRRAGGFELQGRAEALEARGCSLMSAT
jgi:hypothetical protein